VETGAITNRVVIAVARVLEKVTYRAARMITVLSVDLQENVIAKIPSRLASRVVVIPNFVDTEQVQPSSRLTPYRGELGIGDQQVVMYAGNVGYSQSLDLMIAAAKVLPDVVFVINGQGSARSSLQSLAAGLDNVIFGDFQPVDRLAEVLATGDVHIVPLQRGLGRVSVPSKVYSIMAAGRPILVAVDAGTEVPRLVTAAQCGVVVEPDQPAAFTSALSALIQDPDQCRIMGENARTFVENVASAEAVARQYALVVDELRH
jgi:colanic acid biosynthesis glycosyl transferase WcaI